VTQTYVVRHGTEERDAFADEHRDARDNETLNQAGAEESLNGEATVDVKVMGASGGEFRNDLSRGSGHLLDDASAYGGEVNGTAAEDDYPLLAIGPFRKGQDGFEGVATYYEGIDAGYEFVVAVRLTTVHREKIESAVGAGDEAVEAGADEDGYGHGGVVTVSSDNYSYLREADKSVRPTREH
jgi:hypothetical protein